MEDTREYSDRHLEDSFFHRISPPNEETFFYQDSPSKVPIENRKIEVIEEPVIDEQKLSQLEDFASNLNDRLEKLQKGNDGF